MAKLRLLTKFLNCFIVILLFCSLAYGASDKTGTASFAYLKLQSSVRAAAMGDALVAMVDDPGAVFGNPAGLSRLTRSEIQITHNTWLAGTAYSNAVYVKPLGRIGVIGGSLTYLDFGEIAETTRTQPGGTGRNFSSSGLEYILSYGYSLNSLLSLGATLKEMQQRIDQSSSGGVGVDLGVLWNAAERIKVGGAIQNIGNNLPWKIRLGASSRWLENKLLAAGELSIPSDNNIALHLGLEYYLVPFLALRGGINTRYEDKAGGNWSLGLGLEWKEFKIDYAYVPYEELGATHRVGLRFGLF